MDISSDTRTDRVVWVSVSGRVDAVESPRLSAELSTHVEEGVAHLTADLADVDYLDSSGLAVLVRTWRQQVANGHRFSVVSPSVGAASRIFSLTGFDTVFDFVEPGQRP